MEVTSSTEQIVNYQEAHNITAKEHKINIIQKINNLIRIYIETTKEVYIDKKERIKPKNSNNDNTDKPDISLDKPKQEIQRKNEGEQEARKTEIMKEVGENDKTNVELVVDSSAKTDSESQQD